MYKCGERLQLVRISEAEFGKRIREKKERKLGRREQASKGQIKTKKEREKVMYLFVTHDVILKCV